MNTRKYFVFRMQGPAWWVWWCFGRLAGGSPDASLDAISEIERRSTSARTVSKSNQGRRTIGFQLAFYELFAD